MKSVHWPRSNFVDRICTSSHFLRLVDPSSHWFASWQTKPTGRCQGWGQGNSEGSATHHRQQLHGLKCISCINLSAGVICHVADFVLSHTPKSTGMLCPAGSASTAVQQCFVSTTGRGHAFKQGGDEGAGSHPNLSAECTMFVT